MPESFRYDKRVKFPKGKQEHFVSKIAAQVSISELAKLCGCSDRTVRDWRRERFTIPYRFVEKMCKYTGESLPKGIRVIDAFSHTSSAGKKGMSAVISKYGRIPQDESSRKKQWREWWDASGKAAENKILRPKDSLRPMASPELAEFIGIMMGDGGMSKYQCAVTLHQINDASYSYFVAERIQNLFNVPPTITDRSDSLVRIILLSRVGVVNHLRTLGLPIGNKLQQGLDIPEWIKENEIYARMCVRGLIDTDGSIFTHSYLSKGKRYSYKKLGFTSASPHLLRSVASILSENGMKPRISGKDVRLDSVQDMSRYFSVIGTSNPKHWKRYAK